MRIIRYALLALAAIIIVFSLMNASWIAGTPNGPFVLMTARGTVQSLARADAACGARGIEESRNMLIENTVFGMHSAVSHGARGMMVDVRLTADGHAVAFRDADLGCRTNGTGPLAARTLAQLKRLDIGWGYTPDDGATFPLRGRGVGGMPTIEEVVRSVRGPQFLFLLHGDDPRIADAVIADLAAAGVTPDGDIGFAGAPAVRARAHALAPRAWVLDPDASARCLDAYRGSGWSGTVPPSCRDTTVVVPLDAPGLTLWGWPYRFLARLQGAGSRVMMIDHMDGAMPVGLSRAEQLPDVPRNFRGILLIEDMDRVGRALVR